MHSQSSAVGGDSHIRPARPEDLGPLEDLEHEAFSGDKMSRRSLRRFLTRSTSMFLVGVREGRVVGAILAIERRGVRDARIYSVAVFSPHRGEGWGRRLVREAEAVAFARGARRMRLEIRRDNEASRGLFRGLGYHIVSPLPAYYEGGIDGDRWERELTVENGREENR